MSASAVAMGAAIWSPVGEISAAAKPTWARSVGLTMAPTAAMSVPGRGATSMSTSVAPLGAAIADDISRRATMPWVSTSVSRSSFDSTGNRNSRSV